MTFDAYEKSAEASRPVELYEFRLGSTAYRYTDREDEATLFGATFLPRQISRTKPSQGGEDRGGTIEIRLPASDTVPELFRSIIPGERMSVTIRRIQRDDPADENVTVWAGFVSSVAYEDDGFVAVFRCRPRTATFDRQVPRFLYHQLCNHVLYDAGCGLDNQLHKLSGSVLDVTGSKITVQGLGAQGATWAVGGYVKHGLEFRLVLAQNDDEVTMLLPFKVNPAAKTVDVFAGCDHSLATCHAKFGNSVNFGGFPWVPTRNVFVSGLE